MIDWDKFGVTVPRNLYKFWKKTPRKRCKICYKKGKERGGRVEGRGNEKGMVRREGVWTGWRTERGYRGEGKSTMCNFRP